MRIEPTVGRIVWLIQPGADQPLAAQIAGINTDGTINIGYLELSGAHNTMQNVPLVQEMGEAVSKDVPHCEWMPFQQGQARAQALDTPKQRAQAGAAEHGHKPESLKQHGHVDGPDAGQPDPSKPATEMSALELGKAARAAGPEGQY